MTETLGSCAESEAGKPVRADGLLSSWRNTQMVRADTTWSVNAYWHSVIQKNYREQLKIGTDGGAALASRQHLWVQKGSGGRSYSWFTWGGHFANLDYLRLGYWNQSFPVTAFLAPAAECSIAHTSQEIVIAGLACFFCLTSSKSRDPTSSLELSDHKTMGF